MIADQWRKIGIDAEVQGERAQSRHDPDPQQRAPHHDLDQRRHRAALPVPAPRHPGRPDRGLHGPAVRQWYASNGAQGKKPTDPNLQKIFDLFRGAASQQEEERIKTAQEIWKILVDQQYGIGTVGQSPAFMGVRLASNKLGNIPSRVCIAQHCRTPGGSHPETWYYQGMTAHASPGLSAMLGYFLRRLAPRRW